MTRHSHHDHPHHRTAAETGTRGVRYHNGVGGQGRRWPLLLPLAVAAALILPGTPAGATKTGAAADDATAPTETVEWSKPKTVPDSQDGALPTRVVTSADGSHVVVVWNTGPSQGGGAQIRAAVAPRGGAKWKPSATIAEASTNFDDVQVLMSDDGSRLTAAWTQRQGPVAYQALTSSSDDGGKTWTPPVGLTPEPSLSVSVRLAASADGRAVVAVYSMSVTAEEPSQVGLRRSADGGRTWSDPAPIATLPEGQSTGSVDVAGSGDGLRLFAVWTAGDLGPPRRWQMYAAHSLDGGDDWSAPVTLSDPAEDVVGPAVVASADGQSAAALWSQSPAGGPYRVLAAAFGAAAGWSDPEQVSDSAPNPMLSLLNVQSPLTMSDDGRTLVSAWQRHEDSQALLEVSASTDGGSSWSLPQTLATDRLYRVPALGGTATLAPDVAASADGSLVAAIWPSPAGMQSATSIDGGQSWSPAQLLADQADSAVPFPAPQVAVSADGSRAVAVWSGTEGEGVSAAFSPIPRTEVKAKPRAGRSKLKVRITPDLGAKKQWKFVVKQRTKNGKWRKVKDRDGDVKVYKTRTPKHKKVINLPKGKYKARSKNARGYQGDTSEVVRLKR